MLVQRTGLFRTVTAGHGLTSPAFPGTSPVHLIPWLLPEGASSMGKSWLNASVIRWPDEEDTSLWIAVMQTLNQQDPCFL